MDLPVLFGQSSDTGRRVSLQMIHDFKREAILIGLAIPAHMQAAVGSDVVGLSDIRAGAK